MAFNLENINIGEQVKPNVEKVSLLQREIVLFKKVFSNKTKEDFYTELSVLLKAGISLKQALELIEASQKKKANKELLNGINHDIIQGSSLSNAVKKYSQFSDYEYYSIKIGEETGTLFQVSGQLGQFYSRKNEQRRNLISALTYPVIILSTALLVVVFMLRFVVPMFQDIFKQQGIDLPAITMFIILVSDFIGTYGVIIFLVLIGVFSTKYMFKNNEVVKKVTDSLILKTPFIGLFIKTVYLSQFTQAVSLLISSKVPVLKSIQLVKQMIGFYPLQSALEGVEQEILRGQHLSESLESQNFFDDKMVALVKVAEETNQTEFVFQRLNLQYETRVQQQSKLLSTVMEPFIILIVGILVGVILIAMYLPMFKLSSVLG
ncbi:type II secretion system F family protein [Aestuariibaculum sediminum]|uniref:Type II secretion system F family protein n=1 Tax=Aestuariibaculum sediminum TaxID=2770637 RepID=A0A8J6QCX7_9FLAO|nr:type II secretion system F family protein [Aestuariibaculum sediminum]MBD0833796.1 type II secretion system F family protein [Aestuariibaculum sediminum]